MPEPSTISKALPSVSLLKAESLLAALPVVVLAVDESLMLRFINPAAEEWLGISAKQCTGQALSAFIDLSDRVAHALDRALAGGGALSDYDCEITPRRAAPCVATLHVTPLEGDAGLLIVIDPKPHAPLLKEQVSRADIIRNSGLMAAMLAHEVKNPLSGIRGAAQLLIGDARGDQQELLTLICDEADRIRGVLAQVEPFSGKTSERAEPVNVHEVLEYVRRVSAAGAAAGIAFTEDFDVSLPPALAARDALVQVLVNIITNAAEALKETPAPVIKLITTARQDFKLGSESGRSLHILVEDNGPGVPGELQSQLFEPFVSSKRAGRGLGLAIAAKIMTDMGGHVMLESSQPGCTRFRVTLPLSTR